MKAIIISTVYPYPSDNGKRIVLQGFLRYFNCKFGVDSWKYICIGDKGENLEGKFIFKSSISICSKLKNIIVSIFNSGSKSIQECVFYDEYIKNEIIKDIENIQPDIILLDTIRCAQLLEDTKYVDDKRIVVYLDDLFSIRYRKMLETKELYPNIKLNAIGNFSKYLPKFAKSIVDIDSIEKMLLKYEKICIEKREIEIASKYNKCLLINSDEAKIINNRIGREKVKSVAPWLKKKKNNTKRCYTGGKDFIFLGSLNISHNRVSIIEFIKKCSAPIRELIPGCKVRIIGKNADEDLQKLVKENSDIFSLEGYVEDLENIMSVCCAMIVPLLFGTGVKLKMIEALYYGVPIISTSYGIEGIELENGKDVIKSDNLNEYPKLMKKMMDIENNVIMSNNEKLKYNKLYSDEAICEQYDNIFCKK